MPSEQPKPTASGKIAAILNKLTIDEAIEAWKESGDELHNRINATKKQKALEIEDLSKKQNQLNGTNTQ